MIFLYLVLDVILYIFVAINESKVVFNITRNFVHQYLNYKNNTEAK